jgi:hypothetical protein
MSVSQQQLRLRRPPHESLTIRFDHPALAEAAQRPTWPTVDRRKRLSLPTTDPRWVFALRVSELLQGDILRPIDRQNLLRLGGVLGLNPFDTNLVIAIVQDRARRGQGPESAKATLALVPKPRMSEPKLRWRVAIWVVAFLAIEAAIFVSCL